MIIMGIDPSYSATGLIVVDTDTWELLYQGVAKNPSQTKEAHARGNVEPWRRTMAAIQATIEAYKVEHTFVEKMRQSKMPMITELLFIASFSARLQSAICNVPCVLVDITGKGKGWYHFIMGDSYTTMKGGLGKVNARKMVERDLGVEMKNEHVADAMSIALTGYFHLTGIDYREVLGIEQPEGVGKTPSKPKEKKSASKRKTSKAIVA